MNKVYTLLAKFIYRLRKDGVSRTSRVVIQWIVFRVRARYQIQKLIKGLQWLIKYIRIRRIPYEAKVFPFVDQVSIVSLGDVTPRIEWLNKFLAYNFNVRHENYAALYNTQVKRYFHQPIGVKGFEITYEGVKYQRQHHPELIVKENTVLELISNCEINSILDLGCADGYYAVLLERQGYKVTAVEGADHYFENAYIVRKCLKTNFRLIHADIENDNIWAFLSRDYFDMTLLLDVIEHCEDPVRLLRRIRNISTYVLIVVPNKAKFLKRRFRRTDIDHIYQFNLPSLKYILNISRFKIREVRKRRGKLFVLAAV